MSGHCREHDRYEKYSYLDRHRFNAMLYLSEKGVWKIVGTGELEDYYISTNGNYVHEMTMYTLAHIHERSKTRPVYYVVGIYEPDTSAILNNVYNKRYFDMCSDMSSVMSTIIQNVPDDTRYKLMNRDPLKDLTQYYKGH